MHIWSLYLTLGIPVIIWNKAATAKLIGKYKAGILINSLQDIEKELDRLNEDKYREMVLGASKLKKRIRDGKFLASTIERIKEEIL